MLTEDEIKKLKEDKVYYKEKYYSEKNNNREYKTTIENQRENIICIEG